MVPPTPGLMAARREHVAMRPSVRARACRRIRGASCLGRATDGRSGGAGAKGFSYDRPFDGSDAVSVVGTYNSDNRRARTFDILVDEVRIGNGVMPQTSVSKFIDMHYRVPPPLTAGRKSITVRFVATGGNEVAPVFAIRTVRSQGA